MSSFLTKLAELEELGKWDEIANVITHLTDEKLLTMLKARLVDNLAPRVVGIILTSFGKSNLEKKKLQLIKTVLDEIPRQAALTAVQTRDLTYAVLSELDSLETSSLVKLVDFCINLMQSDEQSKECWKEILPRLLLLLKEKPLVSHCGHEMSGADYRSQVVKSLCNTEWRPQNITMIAAMFRELPVAGDEFKQVVDKLLDGLDELEASEVPPFVYQMLRLCSHQHFLLVLMHVQRYYNKNAARAPADNEDIDSIEAVEATNRGMSADLKQSESMVLFHVQRCAAQDPQSSRNLATNLSLLTNTPEIIFGKSNFLLSAILMVCDVATLREKFLAILVSNLVRSIQDEEIRSRNTWTASVLASQNKLEPCLKGLIENTDIQRGAILEQLVKLCFELLLNKKSGRAAEDILKVAANTLMHIARKQPDSVSVILELLVNNIAASKADPHLLRCLKRLIAMTPAKLLIKAEFISVKMVEHLVNMRPATAEQSVVAMIPLLSISEGLCNSLILNLRKAINRPLVATKQMAVTGLLTMLQRLRVKKFAVGSQAFSSSSSLSSQISAEITHHGLIISKDLAAINLELIQILTPALSCQAEVRLRLYEGIHPLAASNADLAPVILHFLYKNVTKCKELGGSEMINYEKCYKETSEEEIVLVEPVGHLIFAIAMAVCHLKNFESEDGLASEMEDYLDKMTEKMAKVTTTDLGFDKDNLIIDEGVKGETKMLVLTLGMNVCEALIGYLIKRWADSKDQHSRKVMSVFNTYNSIQDHIKGCKRPTKKKQDANNTVVNSQNPRKRGRPSANIPSASKEKGSKQVGGICLPLVLDLSTLHLTLQLLYSEDVDWADKHHANILQNKIPFQLWVLNSLMQAISHYKTLSSNGLMEKTSYEFKSFCYIGRILLDCIPKVIEVAEDSIDVALLQLESLSELLSLFQHDNRTMLEQFISALGNGNMDESIAEIIPSLQKLIADFLKYMYENEDVEQNYKKLPRLAVSIASQIASLLNHSNPVTATFVKWVQQLARQSECRDEQVVKAMLELLLQVHSLCSRTTGALRALASDVRIILGTIEEAEKEQERKILLIGDGHAAVVVQVICAHIRDSLDIINVLIQRLRSERSLQPYQINPECADIVNEVGDKETLICDLMDTMMSVLRILLTTKMSMEQGEALLRDICHVYRTASSLSKHFAKFSSRGDPSFRRTKFPVVVNVAGNVLPPLITSFISYLEEKQKEKYQEMQVKKSYNAKVAQKRVLRESDTFARAMFEYEKFSKSVFQLSAKLKDASLKDCLNLGPSYDFRINYQDVQEKLRELQEEEEEDSEGEEMDED
ncbi:Fanconi anemia group I protein-like [Neocloeon triangulifer]|uniref:Fanconi anemia group I protein-like n=1 Tax=Neocloeon triangulifer TaxID=2078957 RepID=UPI00286F8EAA|nr:Fanconi anemia group I protein-like [Neocloeon triangulifer]